MSLFVKPTDTFSISFVTATDPDNDAITYIAVDEECLVAAYPKSTSVEKHSIVFRFPTYRDNANALDDSIEVKNGKLQFQTSLLRLNRMARLTKEWTFKDEKGDAVEITPESVGNLNPSIATYIGERMEEVLGIL
jgi:hypothetical protein